MRRYTQLNLLCLVVSLALHTQVRAQRVGLKLYDVNDGLPSSNVYAPYQDKYGYLWIGTQKGLSRFDGRQFVNYGISDGLPTTKTGVIFQDSKERLWVGTPAGMARFIKNRFVTYPSDDKSANSWVFNFIEINYGKVWALTKQGIYEFAGEYWKKIRLCPGFDNSPCRDIVSRNGELYINYETDIVCRNKRGKWMHVASQHDYGSLFNVMSVQNGQICISTRQNIYVISNYHLKPLYKKPFARSFFSYMSDSKKRFWIVGNDLLKISEPNDWQHFDESVDHHGYHSFLNEDSSHNIWIGTMDGLVKANETEISAVDKVDGIPLDGIYNLIATQDSCILISSGKKNGIQLYKKNSWKRLAKPAGPNNEKYYRDPVDSYTFDDSNMVWMTTRFRKLLNFDGKKLTDYSSGLHLKTDEGIYSIDYSKKRNQFFICADSTLLYGNPSKFSVFIPGNTHLPIIKPTQVHELKNGLLLLYLDGQGIYAIDSANNLICLVKETQINGEKKGPATQVSFYEGRKNNFWVTVPGWGLYEYEFTENKLPVLKNHFTVTHGLESNDILSLTSDLQNRLWIASNGGLDVLQQNKSGHWDVFNYIRTQDLAVKETDYEKLVCDKLGQIWLSSPSKLIKFNSGRIKLTKEKPRIIIEKVALNFKETDWHNLTDSLYSYFELPYKPVLSYNQNSLGIFFNAIDLSTSNSSPEYSYKLLPLDTSWSLPSKTKSVSLAQLPPGKYQFIVRTKDLASNWSKPAFFGFTIKPPFWGTWWFRIAVIISASLIIIGISRARIKKIRKDAFVESQLKELEMKALKAQMNPHFIYNALNSIQALVANDKKMEGIRYIGSFSRLLRRVLDNSENNVINLDKELEIIDLYIELESLRLDMQLQYKKIIAENIVPEFEKIPALILQPFIENALWHGLSRKPGKKEIKITIDLDAGWLVCTITDNGIGREKAGTLKKDSPAIYQSKGIDITRQRLIDFNGPDASIPIEFIDLYDDKKNAAGTRVIVRIKRKRHIV